MQYRGAESYARTRQAVAGPRELEASLLAKAAGKLQLVRDDWGTRQGDLEGALTYNRKLWTIFVTAVTGADSQLPAGIRQNIANLGAFIFKQTMAILASPEPQKLTSLISINRLIAEGLRGVSAGTASQPAA